MAKSLNAVSLWIKAFIPGDVPGLSKKLMVGNYAGRSALPGPVDDWYLTDERSWSSSLKAKARITFVVCVEFVGSGGKPHGSPRVYHNAYCDVTTAIDPDTGVSQQKKGVVKMKIKPCVGGKKGTWMDETFIRFNIAACNPFFSIAVANVSPNIDLEGRLYISPNRREVWVEGKVDEFPAYEMYAVADVNLLQICAVTTPKLVHKRAPDPGMSPNNLWGSANRTFKSYRVLL